MSDRLELWAVWEGDEDSVVALTQDENEAAYVLDALNAFKFNDKERGIKHVEVVASIDLDIRDY